MSEVHRLRLYRLWRSTAVLGALGAAEFGVLAWQRQLWWLWPGAALLLGMAGLAARRARALRHGG